MKQIAAPLAQWDTPTQWLLRVLHLPERWNTRIDAWRVQPKDLMAQRRDWIIESLALLLSFALAGLAVPIQLVVFGWQEWSIYWVAGGAQCVATYFLVLRGFSRFMTLAGILTAIWFPLWTQSTYHGQGIAITFMGCTYAMMLATMTEPVRWILAYGAMSLISMGVSTRMAQGNSPIAGPLFAFTFALVALAVTGGRISWEIFAHLVRSAEQNHNLNEDLLRANAELEERVAQRTQELEDMAVRDELTGLYNRRHFTAEMASMRMQGRNCAMLMVDVDHFKRVNDTLGHAVGDVVLRRVAADLRRHLRGEDFVARIGGEEFVVVLSDTSLEAAMGLAERLRSGIAEMTWADIPVPNSRVTTSVGVAVRLIDGPDASGQLMRDADQALYEAKANGRNQVVEHRGAMTDVMAQA